MVSFGLHLGLGTIGWQGFGGESIDSAPIMVALADRSATEPVGPLASKPSNSLRGHSNSAPVATTPYRITTPPVETSVASLSANEPPTATAFCAIPETTNVETVAAVAGLEGFAEDTGVVDSSSADGEGSGSGFVLGQPAGSSGGSGGGEGQSAAGLVVATPRYASNPRPDYPRLARQNRWEGVVHLRATISTRGEVESLVIENSSGHQVLDASALRGVRRWRFMPARRGDIQVPCEVRIPVAFKLER